MCFAPMSDRPRNNGHVLSMNGVEYTAKPHFWSKPLPILRGVSLAVQPAEIFGFLGLDDLEIRRRHHHFE